MDLNDFISVKMRLMSSEKEWKLGVSHSDSIQLTAVTEVSDTEEIRGAKAQKNRKHHLKL